MLMRRRPAWFRRLLLSDDDQEGCCPCSSPAPNGARIATIDDQIFAEDLGRRGRGVVVADAWSGAHECRGNRVLRNPYAGDHHSIWHFCGVRRYESGPMDAAVFRRSP
jgi:hypothetical protein